MGDDLGRDLHLPVDREPAAAAVVLHPHPSMGGDRHHPLVVAICEGLAAAGWAAVRVDLRDPDVAVSAKGLEGLCAALTDEVDVKELALVGYSWGSAVVATAAPVGLRRRVLVAPPVSMIDLDPPTDELAALLIVPEHDQYGGPDAVRASTSGWPDTTVEVIEDTDHFLAGAINRIAEHAVKWVAAP